MKKLTFVLIAFLYAGALIAQENQEKRQESDRGDNTIILETEDNFEDAFRKMGQMFVANGFTIDNADRDFGTITTREVRFGSRLDPLWEMKLTAMISGSDKTTIKLTAMARDGDGSWQTLEKKGRMHMMRKGWDDFEDLAKEYDNATIHFKND